MQSAVGESFVFLSLVVGMAICAYWAAYATRLGLKLKLRYFQARYLERKMNTQGEFIISEEGVFFNPTNKGIESPDKEEHLLYPAQGAARMDGFIGSAKPNYFSLLMPCMFFVIYWVVLLMYLLDMFIL